MLNKNNVNKSAVTLMIAFLSAITASAQIHKMERRDSVDGRTI